MLSKFLTFVKQYQEPIYLGLCIILVGVIGYNIGRINTLSRGAPQAAEADIFQTQNKGTAPTSNKTSSKMMAAPVVHTDMRVLASKKSKSKLYHFTWCSGAKSIKEENKLWFDTAEAAQIAGYTLAGNCTR